MKGLWIAMPLCAGAILLFALAAPGDLPRGAGPSSPAAGDLLHGLPPVAESALVAGHNATGTGNRTALFSKEVAAGTRSLVVSLYSGDTADPISVTVITPDRTLGPYYDESDGIVDGRIDLLIRGPGNVTPGVWRFLVRSNKEIATGNLENLSWIRTGPDNHKADE